MKKLQKKIKWLRRYKFPDEAQAINFVEKYTHCDWRGRYKIYYEIKIKSGNDDITIRRVEDKVNITCCLFNLFNGDA